MAIEEKYMQDAEMILSHRSDNGADLWATPDGNLIKGAPFSTIGSMRLLAELGLDKTDQVLAEAGEMVLAGVQDDGRIRVTPKGTIYPCQTINALLALCALGYADDKRLENSFAYLLSAQEKDGGWRCLKFSYGRGPETEASNPFPALNALQIFTHTPAFNKERRLDQAVEFLLQHWETKKPLGPCHYGIGTLFMQAEYPFRTYNLFSYVYTLSFYDYAKKDPRFLEALAMLKSKTKEGQIVVERVVPKLAKLSMCTRNQPSELATRRYQEILANAGCSGSGENISKA